jgi:peptide-methionine (S)-S-oxide reductase
MEENIILGGGCFWCLEGMYNTIPGVTKVVSGYAGGTAPNPTYQSVCSGETGHAEVVKISFNPEIVTCAELLELFFEIHDPTSVTLEDITTFNGKKIPKGTPFQGNDYGSQYRSIIIYQSDTQKMEAIIAKEHASIKYKNPIVTTIEPLEMFYPAEDYHQDYFVNNSEQPYCKAVVGPKIRNLRIKLENRKSK